MQNDFTRPEETAAKVSPHWKYALALVIFCGMAVLIRMSLRSYGDAPPVPAKVTGPTGQVVFTGTDIRAGQEVFLKYGLMDNGTIWGHGAYLGPDFSAAYLHTLGLDAFRQIASKLYGKTPETLSPLEKAVASEEGKRLLRQNRYDPKTNILAFTRPEVDSFQSQIARWTAYFKNPDFNGGLRAGYISNPKEIRELTAFFAWAAWASVADRPGRTYSYTNNFPYDPLLAGSRPPFLDIPYLSSNRCRTERSRAPGNRNPLSPGCCDHSDLLPSGLFL
ncbi:MAG: hypothetical protein ACP5SH_27565 [Syntrophobacteraceae bacterium]